MDKLEKKIWLTIRVMPSGFERDIEVLNTITGQDVLNEILSWDEVEIKRPGERYAYRLIIL